MGASLPEAFRELGNYNKIPLGGTYTPIKFEITYVLMDNNQAGQANPQNNYWGDENQGKAGKENGPMIVNDPLGQITRGYIKGGNNQPALHNIRKSLEHQFQYSPRLNGSMFGYYVQTFMLWRIIDIDPELANRLLSHRQEYPGGPFYPPKWYLDNNSEAFRRHFPYDRDSSSNNLPGNNNNNNNNLPSNNPSNYPNNNTNNNNNN